MVHLQLIKLKLKVNSMLTNNNMLYKPLIKHFFIVKFATD